MGLVTHDHFGGNLLLTQQAGTGSTFREMSEEVSFNNIRYPGGTVTEQQTWENGGLGRVFGEPMDPSDPNYVLTIREALDFASETDSGMTIVVPTFQFYDEKTGSFDHDGFEEYLYELEVALREYPEVDINDFEIGNEYWAEISASDYGKIANEMIPMLDGLGGRLSGEISGWEKPGIGIQAGRGWRPDGDQDSLEIADEIDLDNRELVTTIYQHAYPNPDGKDPEAGREYSMDAMEKYEEVDGFRDDLKFSISEFNTAKNTVDGVEQASVWVEEFGARVDMGVDEYLHWGLDGKWLSNKFYDNKFPVAESDSGEIVTIATPMGQVYDIASAYLPGKSTIDDLEAVEGIDVPKGFTVTGFSDAGQRIVFLYNDTDAVGAVDLSRLPAGFHVTTNQLVNADSPHTTWYDESAPDENERAGPADSRGDMKVLAGDAAPDQVTLNPGEMVVVVVSDPDRDLIIEGAHNETDSRSDMVDDIIVGGNGDDIIRGHVGDDSISGGNGRDVISAGKGNDTISGDAGDDILTAGRGANELDGGGGNDVFVISGGRAEDGSTIETGEGDDLVLTADDQNLTITDFESGDRIGFDGAFEDVDAFSKATSIDGDDLIVSLPGGGSVRIVGCAEDIKKIQNQIVDFSTDDDTNSLTTSSLQDNLTSVASPVGEEALDGLTYEQLVEAYDIFGDIDGLCDDTGSGYEYWLGLEETIERTGATPYTPPPYSSGSEEGSVEEPVIPVVPPDDDDEEQPAVDDEEDEHDEDSGTGGACFVATAAFGDRMHPDVVDLRRFRDCHLVKYSLGRRFIKLYWKVGPVLAKYTRPQDPHAAVARRALTALVKVLRKYDLC